MKLQKLKFKKQLLASLIVTCFTVSASAGTLQTQAYLTQNNTIDIASRSFDSATNRPVTASIINSFGNVTGSASANADYGLLGASSSISAFDGAGSSNGFTGYAHTEDNITITSSTLAYGTAVVLNGTMYLDAILSSPLLSISDGVFSRADVGLNINSGASQLVNHELRASNLYSETPFSNGYVDYYKGSGLRSYNFSFNTFVGDILSTSHSLSSDSYAVGSFSGSYSSFADASHTAGFFLNSTTSDVSWISASGATYTNPVPEPDSYALLLGGLGLLSFIARRRKNQQA